MESDFTRRIRHLRTQSNRTQAIVAQSLGVSRSTYAKYETGENEPDHTMLLKLASYFGVSIDYLLGRSQRPGQAESEKAMAQTVREWMDEDSRYNATIDVSPEEREFLDWVKENLEGTFFYDFDKSPEDSKKYMMETLRMVWERERGRRPGQKQGE